MAIRRYGGVPIKRDSMNFLNMFRWIRAFPSVFAEAVSAVSADVALYVAVPCLAQAVLPDPLRGTGGAPLCGGLGGRGG